MSKRVGRPKLDPSQKTKKPTDRITCDLCGKEYTRANRSTHNKTKIHQQAVKYETLIRDTLHQQIPERITLKERAEYPYYDWNGERIYMTEKKFNYYNTISLAKNGYPLYFKSLKERKKIMLNQGEIDSDEEDDKKEESSESDSDNEKSNVIIPYWFIKKIDDPKTTKEELKKMLIYYNQLSRKTDEKDKITKAKQKYNKKKGHKQDNNKYPKIGKIKII
jgi:hypothetical protein